ncbi:MAG: DUF1330 domain-containing protein [bacterium]
MIYMTVELTIAPGMQAACYEYERTVLALFREHGGRVIVAYRPSAQTGEVVPDEVQILSIESHDHLAAYMADPRRQALAEARTRAILETRVVMSEELLDYSSELG